MSRTLVLLRGSPASGKSTWIKEHNLQNYTICPDKLRTLCSSMELKSDGTFRITQEPENEKKVWNILTNN